MMTNLEHILYKMSITSFSKDLTFDTHKYSISIVYWGIRHLETRNNVQYCLVSISIVIFRIRDITLDYGGDSS